MPARFRVFRSFPLPSRGVFVLAGEVVSGTVRGGMQVHVPFNDAFAMTAPIHAVEEIRSSDGRENVGLLIAYEDGTDLSVWEGLNIGGGEVLDVTEAPEEAPAATPTPPRRPWWRIW